MSMEGPCYRVFGSLEYLPEVLRLAGQAASEEHMVPAQLLCGAKRKEMERLMAPLCISWTPETGGTGFPVCETI